ncbi:hypothetical protein GDO86_008750 [Hymenochirus boettgeri]|uniref:Uncharacterized protein n=1 Tax=Hymenochirus boettgeri TaxID=247094 RepID=A0A8T2J2Y4_9PIPI|nr:hypothetical protein GDO86_008750 [Hymenochirus boettgeri]
MYQISFRVWPWITDHPLVGLVRQYLCLYMFGRLYAIPCIMCNLCVVDISLPQEWFCWDTMDGLQMYSLIVRSPRDFDSDWTIVQKLLVEG